ncbi:hypothetical protein GOODEAATRI_023208, partial [Goodea atripinnis]
DLVEYNFKQAQNSSIRPRFVSLSYKLHPSNHVLCMWVKSINKKMTGLSRI